MKKQKPEFKEDKDTLPYLEEARCYYLRLFIVNVLLGSLFVLLGLGLLIGGMFIAEGKFTVLFTIIGLLVLILLPIIFYLKASRRPRQYRTMMYSTLLSFYAFGQYDLFAFIYKLDEDFLKKDFLIENSKPIQEDATSRYKGNIKKVQFTSFFYECNPKKKEKVKGRFISFQLPVFVHSPVYIIDKRDRELFSKEDNLSEIKTLDDEFHDTYIVLAEKREEGLRVVNDNRIEGIKKLVQELNCRIDVFFIDRRCFIYLNQFQEKYQPSFFHKVDEQDLLGVKENLHLIHKIYLALNLNEGNE